VGRPRLVYFNQLPETLELRVIQQWKEWLATNTDGNLPTNQKMRDKIKNKNKKDKLITLSFGIHSDCSRKYGTANWMRVTDVRFGPRGMGRGGALFLFTF
jgi:hypothetical protein